MKKIIAFLITIAMVVSMFGVVSFAATTSTTETTVWTQDFEQNKAEDSNVKWSDSLKLSPALKTYATGARFAYASNGAVTWTENAGRDASKAFEFHYKDDDGSNKGAGARVYFDQSTDL